MADNSLFAVLLRSSWWISVLIALGIALVSRFALPADYWLYGAFGAIPFLVIAIIAARRQLQAPSARRVAATLATVRKMSAADFSASIESALRADGYEVRRLADSAADFELRRSGRVALLGWRRWKAARIGVEPLRDLHAAVEAADAHDCVFVATGEITDAAREFAARHRIRLVQGPELTRLLHPRRSARVRVG